MKRKNRLIVSFYLKPFHSTNFWTSPRKASIYTPVIVVAKINELKFELLTHASSGLASLHYSVENGSVNNKEVEFGVNGYFEELDGSRYKQCIEAIEHRREECIELNGNYVEK